MTAKKINFALKKCTYGDFVQYTEPYREIFSPDVAGIYQAAEREGIPETVND